MADESMSAIQFRTTLKGDLPHYFYIFRKLGQLVTEMKNVACSRLRTMLHLEILKGKDAVKTSKFLKYLGGTNACMKKLAVARNYIFGLIRRRYCPKRDILDYWGTIVFF